MGKLGYKAALQWLLENDDTSFIDDEPLIPSVTLCLVADIFGVDTDKALNDLIKRSEAVRKLLPT
jgi:hypothetical protein